MAKFWTKIFALSFAFGVVTGIPLEFQFGTNWAKFSNFAGGVIGQTLAMEGFLPFSSNHRSWAFCCMARRVSADSFNGWRR